MYDNIYTLIECDISDSKMASLLALPLGGVGNRTVRLKVGKYLFA